MKKTILFFVFVLSIGKAYVQDQVVPTDTQKELYKRVCITRDALKIEHFVHNNKQIPEQ